LTPKTGLYIGRFQPFHLGHLFAIKFALKAVETLYIAIGSAQKSYEPRNPFTAAERLLMLKAALDEARIPAKKWLPINVPDATAHAVWTAYLDMLVPPYEVAFTNEPLTTVLLRARGVKVVAVPLQKRGEYAATEIRDRMRNGRDWRKLVPEAVSRILLNVSAVNRLKDIGE
jgi:nicotinamide-nucleotide adenylyltransferase